MANRLRLYLGIVLVMCMTVVNSTRMQSADQLDSLLLRVLLPEPSVCSGTTEIEAELELRNIGTTALSVSPKGFGSAVDFLALYNAEDGRPRSESIQTVGDSFSKPEVPSSLLKPGESIRAPGKLILGKPFFQTPGFYKVRIDYSGEVSSDSGRSRRIHLSSNWVLFEVKHCEP